MSKRGFAIIAPEILSMNKNDIRLKLSWNLFLYDWWRGSNRRDVCPCD